MKDGIWDRPLVLTRAFTLEIGRGGELIAAGSISRPPQQVKLDVLPVLRAFAGGSTPRRVLEELRREWELEAAGFAVVVEGLLEQNLLTPAAGDGRGISAARSGFADVRAHLHMLEDVQRVLAYRAAIFRHAPGRRVLEIGCGSGILSLFAAQAGARSVVAVEESAIADLAAEVFAANGCEVELLRANSRDVELDEPAEVLVHELIGVDPFGENLLPSVADGRRRLLAPGGRLIPGRLEVLARGYESRTDPGEERSRVLGRTAELDGLYGADLSPLRRALAALPAGTFTGSPVDGASPPRLLTEPCRLFDLDLYGDLEDREPAASAPFLRADRAGSLGGVVLYFRAHLDDRTVLSNAPLAPPTHWARRLCPFSRLRELQPGDEVPLRVELVTLRGRQVLDLDLV